jgi:Flp pilus assembly protein TadB
VTVDTELEAWRREWRDQTEPFPMLKRKIRRQNLRIAGAVAAIAVCLVVSVVEAVRTGNAFLAGLATGIGFAGIVQGGYSWWVRRGAWRPAAQTTLAYAELAYKRAAATARTTRFSFRFLVIAAVLYAGIAAWYWETFSVAYALILVAMVIEAFWLNYNRRRAARGLEDSRKLWEQMQRFSNAGTEER